MNEDDYWVDALRNHVYKATYDNDWSWAIDKELLVDPAFNMSQVYDMIRKLDDFKRKDTEMAYSFNRGYYNDTRGDEVATAVLEAYANGVDFETLIQKNKTVRQYWYQIQSEKAKAAQAREREKERLAKLAEKRALEKAKKDEVLAKLTDEELEAFGFVKNKKKVTKR